MRDGTTLNFEYEKYFFNPSNPCEKLLKWQEMRFTLPILLSGLKWKRSAHFSTEDKQAIRSCQMRTINLT